MVVETPEAVWCRPHGSGTHRAVTLRGTESGFPRRQTQRMSHFPNVRSSGCELHVFSREGNEEGEKGLFPKPQFPNEGGIFEQWKENRLRLNKGT